MINNFPVSGVINAHTHLMPERLMTAIRGSLSDAAGWSFDHPTDLDSMTAALERAGVERCLALPYAHRPGVAAELNEWICETTADSETAVPFATVHAADEDVGEIVESAFEHGARGLKFQLPVQGFSADDPRLDPAYEVTTEWDCPVLFHAGTAPMFRDSPAVGIERFRSFVDSYPEIRACGAHMGTYEHEAFMDLARDRENVFLDTTFAMSAVAETYMDFDPSVITDAELTALSDRIMYGSDYPNIPYPYDRERAHLLERDLSTETQRDIFFRTARRFLGEL